MSNRIKLVVLGGSGLATPKLFEAMAAGGAAASYDAVLVGRDAERLEMVARVSRDGITRAPRCDIRVTTSTHPESALAGADFVLNQIRVGGLQARAFDETFPRAFGIPGEETVGPGGFNLALRTIPAVLGYCRVIEKVAPGALLLNLTNPSSIVQYAIRRYTPVRVVGTCDSPIAMMEMVARVLKVPVSALEFDMAGMHHFGWIGAVRHDGVDRLGYVLDHLDDMPKLEVDAELVRALGAIPSLYLKYYFHPDRVLAATEGRPTRAQELIALTEQMREEYRGWQPGRSLAALNRRGAAWYEKIVVPVLLALAEKRSGEFVVSVENGPTLPWLPPSAIVEAPVTIRQGCLGEPRGAELPRDVVALIQRDSAYEMLAAEAIVEQDRPRALRALMANLMVSNFNQARGILTLVWESADQRSVKREGLSEEKRPPDVLKVPRIVYGERLLEELDIPEEEYALVTMEEPWELARARWPRPPAAVLFVRELDWYRLEALERALAKVDAVVGLGGGTAMDAAKYISWRRHIPVDEIPSIVSVDACVTKSIAARIGGRVTYIGYIVPRRVYLDFSLVRSAPPRLNRGGLGDIISAHTALWDWKWAHETKGEPYDPHAVKAMRAWLDQVPSQAAHIRQVDDDAIRFILDAFADISVICRRYGSSRPQEGSEHTFAYNAEFQTRKSFLHGELIALGAFIMATLQENRPEYLADLYMNSGILWHPREIGLTKEELVQTLRTLNEYQRNYGRRYSVLDERVIDEAFIQKVTAQMEF